MQSCKLCNTCIEKDMNFCGNCKERMWYTIQSNSELFFEGHTALDDIIRIADKKLLAILFRINMCPGGPIHMDLVDHAYASEVYEDHDPYYLRCCMDISTTTNELWTHVNNL